MRMVAVLLAGFVQSQTPSPCLSALAWRDLVVDVCSSAPVTASSGVVLLHRGAWLSPAALPTAGSASACLREDTFRGRGLRLRGELDARDPRGTRAQLNVGVFEHAVQRTSTGVDFAGKLLANIVYAFEPFPNSLKSPKTNFAY